MTCRQLSSELIGLEWDQIDNYHLSEKNKQPIQLSTIVLSAIPQSTSYNYPSSSSAYYGWRYVGRVSSYGSGTSYSSNAGNAALMGAQSSYENNSEFSMASSQIEKRRDRLVGLFREKSCKPL